MYTTASERAPAQAANRQPKGIVFGLAKADLRHEWLLTMCLLMAVAAVLAPLLLLFGLKYGTIETLRSRLVQDPRNRAIKPLISRSFTPAWFARMQPRLDIGFIIPTTRQISATITARVKTGQAKAELNLIPTGEHDPLLLENGVSIPGQGTCVLTHFAAEELNAQIGDTILTTAKRIVAGQYEAGDMELRVVGILSLRASALKSMYVPLDVLEAVERFKDGQAVPEFDWPGSTPTAYPQYDGLIIILPRKLTAIEAFHLRNNTGFSTIAELTHAELRAKTFIDLGEDGHLYFLATQQKPVGAQSIATVRHKLRGKQATLLPWVAPMPAQLRDASGADIARLTLYPLSIPPQKAAALELTPHPPWDGDETTLKIMLPAHLAAPSDGLTMHISNGKTALTFPVSAVATHTLSDAIAFIPSQLSGVLNLSQQRHLTYDAKLNAFVLSRRGFASFRLYARTIDDVDGLRQYFATEGIPVHTEAQRIKDVKDLDRYLGLIFWFIAAVGVMGGTTALIASLYGSVERKKRELGVLRLLGLSRSALCRYPIYQAILIGIGGFLIAIGFFQVIALTINRLFRAHLGDTERFCTLPLFHAGGALTATILVAMLASTWASWRVTRIEPAEALRDE